MKNAINETHKNIKVKIKNTQNITAAMTKNHSTVWLPHSRHSLWK